MNQKKCPHCNKIKLVGEFYKDRSVKCGYKSWCKVCDRSRKRKYRKSGKYSKKEYFYNIEKLYGLTLEEYNKIYSLQRGICYICGYGDEDGRRLCVDHDHNTGKVRGLLCRPCNSRLGWFEQRKKLILNYIKRGVQ